MNVCQHPSYLKKHQSGSQSASSGAALNERRQSQRAYVFMWFNKTDEITTRNMNVYLMFRIFINKVDLLW